MTRDVSILFLLRNHNEIDQMSPVLYKLGRRGRVSVDVLLKNTSTDDYRINAVSEYDNISVYGTGGSSGDQTSIDQIMWSYLKQAGRKVPTKIFQLFYNKYRKKTGPIPSGIDLHNYSVVLFDWTMGKGNQTNRLAEREDLTTVVFPHGDSPFVNRLETYKVFNEFVGENRNFQERKTPAKIGYSNYENMLKHDYALFPNKETASRIEGYCTNNQVKVLGSPRYNLEWLDVLDDITPSSQLDETEALNIVFFLRPGEFFVSTREVEATLDLVNAFPGVTTIVKEHPRKKLLDSSVASDLDSVSIVDDIESVSLIDWGDIFLSLGTTIAFEPVMKGKPVLALEYTHANHTILADYFPNADMRSKEEVYRAIHDLLEQGTSGFYNEADRRQFVEEMITNSTGSVLDAWAEFIEREATGEQSA
ncbi:hypothetical protein [Halovenus salina]|uniref:CDP-Glycerol:Poly(Glycerophosphate) glycerophosphotransferase n=1 Tax=Halovenus salina TaxID=1510225 RepID=A0ABD5VWY1_9EURY|nr:hypothetical protein [Halovenus salina]